MAPLLLQLAVLGAALVAAALVLISIVAFITASKMPALHQHEEEKFFLNAKGQKETLPSIWDSPTKQLSVVVPSYNEEKRLPVMMDEALGYLEKRQKRDPAFTYEVIVVDDGSRDQTSKVAFKYCQKYGSDKVRVITLVKNRGKGGAIRMGIFSSRGEKILMADADGATKFPDVEKLEKGLKDLQPWPNQMAIACGSRAHLEKESIAQVIFMKMESFSLLTRSCEPGCQHSQNKQRKSMRGRKISDVQAFDVELLYIAQFFKIPVAEIAVNWTEIEGSKLVPFWSWLQMGKDLLFIRLRYLTGAWRLEQTGKMN
ncbi:dolichyl-phosphate beta-glucosyltransferase isoform X2 [Callithrix jacchus]|uniref:Dolichyl-phosphate beta-glucosyltransferase n=1 Tax=Callithrix jacchus TaxID=9483 RepID=A0A8I3WZY3_CALJA|nr:dolichyl-phosphate beta-glucosyltransferase isoform X2 [Callithrix jacchus]